MENEGREGDQNNTREESLEGGGNREESRRQTKPNNPKEKPQKDEEGTETETADGKLHGRGGGRPPPEKKRPTGRGEQDRRKRRREAECDHRRGTKRHVHDKEGEGAQKTPRVTASAQREVPVTEVTGDLTEAEERPETNRKSKNVGDRQKRGKKPDKRTTTGKPGRSAMWENPREGNTNQSKRRRTKDMKEKLAEKGIMCGNPKRPRAGKRSTR